MQPVDPLRPLSVEAVYDRYAAMLYPILLDSCQCREQAEKVLQMTFSELPNHELTRCGKPVSFITLVRMVLANARREGCTRNHFSLKAFQHCPLLHKLIVQDGEPDAICNQLNISRTEFARRLRGEMKSTSRKEQTLVQV